METFKKDVDNGLSSKPKKLSSKYFYNERGDALFVQIMHLPEYYLTACELEIFKEKTSALIQALGLEKSQPFQLIELGAGDGTKTLELLRELQQKSYAFTYTPVDISPHALEMLEANITSEISGVTIVPKQGDYFEVLAELGDSHTPKVVLFLGSNIGNMNDELAASFIKNLSSELNTKDQLLLGVDLIKPKAIVAPAYNDSKGITASFNLNLLTRINDELGGDFDLSQFEHKPQYDEDEGIAKSFIVSKTKQTVHINGINKSYSFEKGEKIQMEISRKYNDDILDRIITGSGMAMTGKIMDNKNYFADYVLQKQ